MGTLNRFCFVFFIIVYSVLPKESLQCQHVEQDSLIFNKILFVSNDDDSISSELSGINEDSSDKGNKNPYVPLSEFMYGDNQRYTISGGLPLEDSHIKLVPTIIFGAGLTAVFVAQHIGQMNTIWKEQGEFKFQEDIEQDFWADKWGHLYGAYFTSYLLSETLMECGLSYDAATVWGAALGLSYSSYVEVLDGFGENWGF
ncbi:MAG: hypothetical protein V1779_15760, partial [bacterium]